MHTSSTATRPWWERSVVYQIYPRSFADSNGDGVGDLNGIRARLDHLSWLGIDTIWLSPIYTSPMADFGYDVADHCAVDPIFGTLDDFDALLDDVHRRGMRLILDWVPNHTSTAHPWFLDARRSRDAAHRDFYIWRDPAPGGGVPNNWTASLTEGPAWTFDEATGQYYLHLFLAGQPDLNWANPEVEAAMHDTLRFWLDRGVDGFRADVVHCIGKDPELADDAPDLAGLPRCILHDDAATHPLLRRIRTLLDAYPQQPMMVGEVVLLEPELVARYLGDQLHLAFNFMPLHLPWNAEAWRDAIRRSEASHRVDDDGHARWPTWVLSNHDVPRHPTRYRTGMNAPVDDAGAEERARAAAVLLLSLRGTPFLYQGEELGLGDAVVPPDRVLDPGGRDGCRAPIPWTAEDGHGWNDPWLPLPPESAARNVATSRARPDGITTLYRRLIAQRTAHPVLVEGTLEVLDAPDDVVAFRRGEGPEALIVLINMGDQASANLEIDGSVLIDALAPDADAHPFPGFLAPRQAVVVAPR